MAVPGREHNNFVFCFEWQFLALPQISFTSAFISLLFFFFHNKNVLFYFES